MIKQLSAQLILSIGLSLILIAGCKQDKPPLGPEQMSKLLLELHLAEAYAQQIPRETETISYKNEDSLLIFNAEILKRLRVSESDFRKSLNWYKSRPELLDSIYQTILSDIAILNSKYNK